MYLLYGEEAYLKRFYRDRLSAVILKESVKGNMNYRYYAGEDATPDIIAQQAEQMPFFADNLLIVVEESGLFKKSSELASLLPNRAETTKLIFVEHDIDKRNALYKYVNQNGTVFELTHYNEDKLISWIGAYLNRSEFLITRNAARTLVSMSGVDMQMLINEMDKLMSYKGTDKHIETKDVEAVCTNMLSNRIFQMMDYIVSGKQNAAIALYADLLAMKEKPLNILFNLTRHINILVMIQDIANQSDMACAKLLSVPSFAVKKYKAQSKAYSKSGLIGILNECISTEERIKSGILDGQIGVEVMIVKLSSML